MQSNKFYKKLLSLVIAILVIGGGLFVWQNKWELHDRWVSKSYRVSTDSGEVLENLDLTAKGELVYKASHTEVDDKDRFKTLCPVELYEEASVLGCYSSRKIYVLKVDEPKLAGVEEVTAAHELLHAQFERMSDVEKKELGELLVQWRGSVEDEDINRLIDSYKKNLSEGEDLNNEIFAIYGTQLKDVGADLEKVYQEYFKDRAGIVKMYTQYSSEFKRIENTVREYDSQLAKLRSEKEELERDLTELGNRLSSQKQDLETLSNSDSVEEYQRLAVDYNAQVDIYNTKVMRIREVVGQYNALVEVRNSEALSAKDLADTLNANVEER